jgi:hypothetical protein
VERKKIEKEVRREHEPQGFNGRFGLVLPTDLFYNTGIAKVGVGGDQQEAGGTPEAGAAY